MKTKEVIRQLQEADPTGEAEVCVGNVDILFIDKSPAYYDGKLQVLERDENQKGYNIVGAKLLSNGIKIVINPMSIYDALWEDPELPIDYSDLHPDSVARYKESHDKTRKQVIECHNKLELEYFIKHIKNRASEITDDLEGVEDRARIFFENNVDYKDPIPKDVANSGESYVGCRNKQWLREIEVSYDGSDIEIKRKKDENSMCE